MAVEVVLADGGSALLRAVNPDDAPRIAAFHNALSLETVHFRYFSALCKLPPLILRRFTQVDFARDMVLVAELGDRLIALASWHRGKLPDSAEVAFVVSDEHQGRGLGTLLLERLAELARERGLTRFRADTLAGNRAMLRVFADAGFALERESDDAAVVHLRFPVAETTAVQSAREQREHLAEARSIARLLAPRTILLAGDCVGDAARLRARRGGALHRCGARAARRRPRALERLARSPRPARGGRRRRRRARPRRRCDRRRARGRPARAVRSRAAPGGAAQRHASRGTRLLRSDQHRALRATVAARRSPSRRGGERSGSPATRARSRASCCWTTASRARGSRASSAWAGAPTYPRTICCSIGRRTRRPVSWRSPWPRQAIPRSSSGSPRGWPRGCRSSRSPAVGNTTHCCAPPAPSWSARQRSSPRAHISLRIVSATAARPEASARITSSSATTPISSWSSSTTGTRRTACSRISSRTSETSRRCET